VLSPAAAQEQYSVSTGAGLWSMIDSRAARSPDAVLGVDERDATLTFSQLRDRAERVAAGLAELGVGEDTRVSWQLPTWLESFVLVGALARLGAVQNPMLPIYREREVRFIVRQARPQLLVVPSIWRDFDYEKLARTVTTDLAHDDGLECSVVVCDRVLPESDPAALPPLATRDDVIRWLFYTSGTTADPKGALHTDASIAAGAAGVCQAFELGEADRYPVVFPFTHIGGIGMLFVQLISGCGAIVVERFDPELTPPLLARHDLTIAAGGTPLALLYLAAQRRDPTRRLFPALRATMTGAAPKPPELHYELKRELGGVGAVSVYGSTEVPFISVSSVRDTDEQLARTEGRAIAGAEIRVVAVDGSVCRPGAVGELRVRGPQVCRGYLDATLDADAVDADGFFRTGDLGALDADGFVTITGRLKDVIIRKGENISAKEVEDVLYTHPAVADVAVIGLRDPELGERCCAVLVLREASAALTTADVTGFCRVAGLANQKIPQQVEIVDELPRNASGKVLKYRLQKRYEGGTA